jgi:hypothetical protein
LFHSVRLTSRFWVFCTPRPAGGVAHVQYAWSAQLATSKLSDCWKARSLENNGRTPVS